MGVKLDMAKAYDRMEWDFIRDTIGFFGFHEKFNLVVKECISSISFSILLNGFPSGKIIPTRGLKTRGFFVSLFIHPRGRSVISFAS